MDEYLVDLNATQAAIRAGYSPKTAHQAGHKLVRKGEVQAKIAAGRQKLAAAVGVTAERLTVELEAVAPSDIGEVLDFTGGTLGLRSARDISERTRRAIASMKVKRYLEESRDGSTRAVELVQVKFWSKVGAIDLLSRRFPHLFSKQQKVSGTLTAGDVDQVATGMVILLRRYLPLDQVQPFLLELRQLIEKSGGSLSALLDA